MCAAPRKPENRGLERNLSVHPTKGIRWRNPQNGKDHYFGLAATRGQANEAARVLNLKFARNTSLTDKVTANASTSVRKLIQLHRETFGKGLAESTTSGRRWELQKLERELGHLDAWDVTTRDLAQYLRTLKSDNVRVRYRARLCELFDTAVAEGFSENNPARALRVQTPEVKRSRLTYEAYQAIYAVAEPWLQNTMDLGLQTLQRRDDIVCLRWSALKDDVLHVEQSKSGGQHRLAIKVSPELRAVLTRCRNRIVCPFIIHRLPEKARPQACARSSASTLRKCCRNSLPALSVSPLSAAAWSSLRARHVPPITRFALSAWPCIETWVGAKTRFKRSQAMKMRR